MKIGMKRENNCSYKYQKGLLLQLMKATVLAESSFISSPVSLCYVYLYRHESGRCGTLPFFVTFFYQKGFLVDYRFQQEYMCTSEPSISHQSNHLQPSWTCLSIYFILLTQSWKQSQINPNSPFPSLLLFKHTHFFCCHLIFILLFLYIW